MALLYRLRFRLRMLAAALTLPPMQGADDPDPKPKPDPDPKPDDEPDPDPKPKPDPDPKPDDEPIKSDDDWQAKARKHEREAKKARKAAEEAAEKLKQLEDADKSEQQKAIDAAREEGSRKAREEADKERRSDRLEVATTRLASQGISIGEGDDAKTVKFADTDDALANVERAIARGDIDADDIYDSEGKVNTEALTKALGEILGAKPHLAAGDGERPKPSGDAGAGKGDAAKKDLESMSVEDHLTHIDPARK